MILFSGMGENNCSWSRKPMLHRNTIKLADVKYKGNLFCLDFEKWENVSI